MKAETITVLMTRVERTPKDQTKKRVVEIEHWQVRDKETVMVMKMRTSEGKV